MATPFLRKDVPLVDDLRRDRSGHVWRRTMWDRCIGWLLPLLFLVAIIPILDLVYWVALRALPTFSVQVLTTNPSGAGGGLYAPLVGSVVILALATGVALLFGFLGGLATAEYLSEQAAGMVRVTANVMAGTPAIVVGLFGYVAFVTYFGWNLSLAAASVTLGIFMTPYVFRATDLAYASVPSHIREAAVGSGARPLQYLLRVATPIAFPQVLSGVFLAMAIGVGETAPIYLTTTAVELPPLGLLQPASALPLYIWTGFQTGYILPSAIHLAFQAAFLLLVIVVGLNILVRLIAARSRRRLEGLFQ
ncbi:MAG TPA: ABC transporter permease subunit [Thermoplasmata archaeon]|nr:ABC transporter permease subunit [Thermoplasmata archaeon]